MHKLWLVLQAIKQFQFQYKRFWSFFVLIELISFSPIAGDWLKLVHYQAFFIPYFFLCKIKFDYMSTLLTAWLHYNKLAHWQSVKGAIKVKIFNNYNNLKPITKANRDPNKGKLHATNSRVPSLRSSKQKLSFWTSVWPALDVGISWGQSLVLSKGVELKIRCIQSVIIGCKNFSIPQSLAWCTNCKYQLNLVNKRKSCRDHERYIKENSVDSNNKGIRKPKHHPRH